MNRYKGKRVVIPGGAGFIGSNLTLRLVEEGADVLIIDNFLPDLGGNLFNLQPVLGRIQLERFDLCEDNAALMNALEGADYVFSLAGNISHKDSIENPVFDLRSNLLAHINLLEAIKRVCPQAVVVYSSTRQIYGAPQYSPVDENHPIAPVDVNGINKYAAEQYYSLYERVHNLKTVSLRLTNTYGPRQLIRHSRQGFIGWFVNQAVSGGKIELFGGGEQLRDLTEVSDVVRALCLSALNPDCVGGIFNLSGFTTSLVNIAETLTTETGKGDLEIVPFPAERKKIDIGNYEGDSTRFLKLTGWKPTITPAEGLRNMVRFYEKNWGNYVHPPNNLDIVKRAQNYEQHSSPVL